jgi:hypothetical protein
MRSLIISALHKILLRSSNKGGRDRGHVAGAGEMINENKILVRKPEGKRPLKSGWRSGLDSNGSVHAPVAYSCEHSTEPLGFTTGGEMLEQLSN